MKVLAIDPGYEKCGFSLFERNSNPQLIESGLIKTQKTVPHAKRLHQLYTELEETIKKHQPDTLAIEKVFFSKNVSTALGVSQSIGIVLLLAAQYNLQILEFTPNQIKEIICGYGNADKKSVQKMLCLQLGREVKVKDDDESDAIACGLAACFTNPNLVALKNNL